MNDEAGDDVGEKHEREPFQNRCDLMVAKKDRGQRNANTKENHKNVRVDAGQHLCRIRHSRKIGTDVD